jgi:hypothetical protein
LGGILSSEDGLMVYSYIKGTKAWPHDSRAYRHRLDCVRGEIIAADGGGRGMIYAGRLLPQAGGQELHTTYNQRQHNELQTHLMRIAKAK